MFKEKQRILILGPHTDDGELGCGASIAKFCDEGHEVFYAVFSTCRESLPKHLAPDALEKEVRKATKILGVPEKNLLLYDFDVRHFKGTRQDILEELVVLRNNLKPTLVFLPSPTDIHQDHQVISEEGIRAFKHVSIMGYEMPWNNLSFNTRSFIRLEDKYLEKKVEALKEYNSQAHRTYLNENFIKSLATTRGVQIGVQYAEAFEVIRWIL